MSLRTRHLAFLFCLILFNAAFAAGQFPWERIAGLTKAEVSPNDVELLDSLVGYSAGTYGIFGTHDGGVSWEKVFTVSANRRLNAMDFCDQRNGMAVGNYGTLLRTTDGGVTWILRSADAVSTTNLEDVWMRDSSWAVAVGWDNAIFITTDAGRTWEDVHPRSEGILGGVHFSGASGLAVGIGGLIFHTSDSGKNWTPQASGTLVSLCDVWMFDSIQAVIVGDAGSLLRTTNAGSHWTLSNPGFSSSFRSIVRVSASEWRVFGVGNRYLESVDGGQTWVLKYFEIPYSFGACSLVGRRGIAAAGNDGIYYTTDVGRHWTKSSYSVFDLLNAVAAVDSERIVVVTTGGKIFRTTDAGLHWAAVPTGTSADLNAVTFFGPLSGTAVGDAGVILRTSDGGETWELRPSGTSLDLRCVEYADERTQIAAGETILRTTNGGEDWVEQTNPSISPLTGLAVRNADSLVAVGEVDGTILRTADGGRTWNAVSAGGSLYAAIRVEGSRFIAGGGYWSAEDGRYRGVLLASSDGGETWSAIPSYTGAYVKGISRMNAGQCIAVSDDGSAWISLDTGRTFQYLGSAQLGRPSGVSMVDSRTVFAVGEAGISRLVNSGSISGSVFHDRNRDGIRNAGEESLGGEDIVMRGRLSESVVTDSGGRYSFSRLPHGQYEINCLPRLYWEATPASPIDGYTLQIAAPGALFSSKDFGEAGPVVRVRNLIHITDDTSAAFRPFDANRQVTWGVRPGATFGVWAASATCSLIDSLEGENEIPPRSFAEFVGLYDARFQDPRLGLREIGYEFGEGTWTDMREFRSETQVDTHFITMLAGYYYGGRYPMTLRWSKHAVARSFHGPVILTGSDGLVVDMKTQSLLVITDSTVSSLSLTAERPVLPSDWLLKWDLASLPVSKEDRSVRGIYPSSTSHAFMYNSASGYVDRDSVEPGYGYWLKHRTGADTVRFDGADRLRDSLALSSGWNLLGTLSAPVAVRSVWTDPPELALGAFFAFDGGYHVSDSLLPGRAYWVKAGGPGRMVLDASSSGGREKAMAGGDFEERQKRANKIHVRDAAGNVGTVYFERGGEGSVKTVELPPLPPSGIFDVRFSSDRLIETAVRGTRRDMPIVISSAKYPLTVSWEMTSGDVTASLIIAGQGYTLSEHGSVLVASPRDIASGSDVPVVLSVIGRDGLPTEFALEQNYPNPFNPRTTINYSIPEDSRVVLKVYNLLGEEVRTLVDEVQPLGYRSVAFDGQSLASGVYFYRVQIGTFSETKKMMFLK